jgi:hypothetical protein
MKVIYNNQLFDLELPYQLFESLKRMHPETSVELMEVNQSSYKQRIDVPVSEVEDWSVYRNKTALNLM